MTSGSIFYPHGKQFAMEESSLILQSIYSSSFTLLCTFRSEIVLSEAQSLKHI